MKINKLKKIKWKIFKSKYSLYPSVINENDDIIYETPCKDGFLLIDEDYTDIYANIIAAAPELLENLIRIIDRIEENNLQDHFPSAYKRAKEVLKKTLIYGPDNHTKNA